MRPPLAIVLAVSVACAHTPARPRALTAEQVLGRMVATYAGASAYRDRGSVETRVWGNGERETVKLTFETAFVRPDRFRFAFTDEQQRTYVVWLDRGHAFSFGDLKRTFVQEDVDLALPISAASGVSDGTADWVPHLLMPNVPGRIDSIELDLDGKEIVDKRWCWRLRGKQASFTLTLYVDANTYLLRRIDERGVIQVQGKPYDVMGTVAFEPSFTRPSDDQLRPPDVAGLPVKERKPPAWMGVLFAPGSTRIEHVMENSPAQVAGMHPGDEVTALDGTAVADAATVTLRIMESAIGSTVTITVKRGGADLAIPLKVAARPREDKMLASLLDKPAPAFSVELARGGRQSLAELRGNVVLLEFWASWCGPCRASFGDLDRLHTKYTAPGLRILALSSEERTVVRDAITMWTLAYPLAFDPDDAIRRQYLAFALPTTVIIDKAGIVRYVHAGVADRLEVEAVIGRLLAK